MRHCLVDEIAHGTCYMILCQLHEACEAGADVNEKFTEDIDPQHVGMSPLALASALNRRELVKVCDRSFFTRFFGGSVVRASVCNWRTFPDLCLIYDRHVTT